MSNPKRFIIFFALTAVLLASVPFTEAQSDIRFGAVEAYHSPGAASQAGVAWERVRFHWAVIQAGGEGSWNDGDFTDDVLNRELAAGRQIVGLLIGVPDWANENGIPRGLNLPYNDPGNTWAVFVRTVVSRYAGRIDHWILWNEPDVWDTNHPGHTWSGSVEDFLQLNRVGYVTAKESNPNAVIHFAGMTYWWDAAYGREPYMKRYLDALVADKNAAGNNYYFDVATLHLYFQPHYIYDITSYYYGLMGSYGIWKPVWIVETNAAPSMDPAWPVAEPRFNISLDEQAAFMPQALALGMAAGAQRIGIYKLVDTPGDKAANPEPFGLVRADGSYRPAFYTFQVAARMLAGVTRVVRDRWDDVGQITLEQSNNLTTVLFSRVPGARTVQVPAGAQTASLVDMWGSRRTITAKDGVFTVDLPAAPCSQSAGDYCIIGGPTYYLVQSGVTAQNPASTPLPQPTIPPTTQPAAAAATTPAEQPTLPPTNQPTAAPTAPPAGIPTIQPTISPTIQPTNTPTTQPTKTPTPQPTSTLVTQSTNLPTSQSTNLPIFQSTNLPIYQSTNLPTSQPTDVPISQSTNFPTSQPTDVPTFQSTNVPIHQSPNLLPPVLLILFALIGGLLCGWRLFKTR